MWSRAAAAASTVRSSMMSAASSGAISSRISARVVGVEVGEQVDGGFLRQLLEHVGGVAGSRFDQRLPLLGTGVEVFLYLVPVPARGAEQIAGQPARASEAEFHGRLRLKPGGARIRRA
jgi:hypothetical protein